MMGQTNNALVTFEGLHVPRFVRFLGEELRCYPQPPREQVCKTCLELGHRADHCPTSDVAVYEHCGVHNPTPRIRPLPGANLVVGIMLLLTRSALDASDSPSTKLGLKSHRR
ncbi:hypothetical protein HPB50_028611 [Hyalomma asiaticum]|nr:hypothetical protein HPB50_028611 [Hyalomma asiaticum]